jgi:transcriptional regulator with XRE-family HTH domain
MHITDSLTDEAILAEVGQRIAQRRLERQLTQADLAGEAGISKRTLEHAEAGANVQLVTIIRIFRVLGLLPNLDQMLPESAPRPIDALKRKGRPRQRASSHRRKERDKPWTWADEE